MFFLFPQQFQTSTCMTCCKKPKNFQRQKCIVRKKEKHLVSYVFLSDTEFDNQWIDNSMRPSGDSPMEMASASMPNGVDCRTALQQAVDSINNGVTNAYEPECDSYGAYKPVQCYKVRIIHSKFSI